MRPALTRVLPSRFFFADDVLTYSARRLLARLGLAAGAAAVAAAGLVLLDAANWREVIAGALLAWSVSLAVWAFSSYGRGQEETRVELRRDVELELLHARLNHLADRLGAPVLAIGEGELGAAITAREERLADFSGLEEFRPEAPAEGYAFWDDVALGWKRERG